MNYSQYRDEVLSSIKNLESQTNYKWIDGKITYPESSHKVLSNTKLLPWLRDLYAFLCLVVKYELTEDMMYDEGFLNFAIKPIYNNNWAWYSVIRGQKNM